MINVNLVVERENQRRRGETAGRIAFFVAVGAFVAAMVVASLQQSRLRATRASIAATQTSIANLQEEKDRIDVVQRQLGYVRQLRKIKEQRKNAARGGPLDRAVWTPA